MDSRTLHTLATASGVNEKGIERLLGSVRVTEKPPPAAKAPAAGQPPPKVLELGFNAIGLLRDRLSRSGLGEQGLHFLSGVLREYAAACPKVAGWLGRGDFKSEKPPEEITNMLLVHACRTAGRLRAKLIRNFAEMKKP